MQKQPDPDIIVGNLGANKINGLSALVHPFWNTCTHRVSSMVGTGGGGKLHPQTLQLPPQFFCDNEFKKIITIISASLRVFFLLPDQ